VSQFESLQRAVEQRHMSDTGVGRKGIGIDVEPVILAGDEYTPRVQLLNRMVGAVVAGLHLDRTTADCQTNDLLAKANAEQGNFALDGRFSCLNRVFAWFWIARAVG